MKIKNPNVQMILHYLHEWQRDFPPEQTRVGSDLFKIERQILALHEKYYDSDGEPRKLDGEAQS